MSAEHLHLLYADLAQALLRMAPQTSALARHERCTPMLQIGARVLIEEPQRAVDELGPRGAKAFARALRAVGQQHLAVADRMDELADERAAAESAPDKPHLRGCNVEPPR